jgi:DNA polymerase-3 subunit epsilon
LAGFNSDRFDIPLLAEELLRAGVDFDMKNILLMFKRSFIKKRANIRAALKLWASLEMRIQRKRILWQLMKY